MSEPMKYRKRPVVIEAIQYDGENDAEINEWSGARFIEVTLDETNPDNPNEHLTAEVLAIETLEGDMVIGVGDFVIRGVQGEHYPCKPDIFAATYEAVSDDRA